MLLVVTKSKLQELICKISTGFRSTNHCFSGRHDLAVATTLFSREIWAYKLSFHYMMQDSSVLFLSATMLL